MSNATLEDLKPEMCRWPIGEPENKDFHFCADKKSGPDTPYCEEHMVKALAPVRKPRASKS